VKPSDPMQRDMGQASLTEHFSYSAIDNGEFAQCDGLVLEQDAMFLQNNKPYLGMCETCKRALYSDKLPAWAIANDNYFGRTVPAELKELTWAELQLISLNRTIVQIKFNGFGDEPADQQQRSLASHMIAFANMTDSMCGQLAMTVENLLDVMKIVFVGQTRPTSDAMRWCCEVNRHRVRRALGWLIKNHKFYKGFALNDQSISEQLAKLPEGEVPDLLYQSVTMSLGDSYDTKVHGDSAGANIDATTETQAETLRSELTSSVAVGPDATHYNDDAEKVHRIRQLVMTAPYQDDDPINTFQNPTLWRHSYPHLYLLGIGGPEDCRVMNEDGEVDYDASTIRRTKLPLEQYFRRLANLNDQRFNHDRSYFGVAWDIIRRRELHKACRILLNLPNDKELLAKVTSVTEDDIKKHLLNFEYSAEAYDALPEGIRTLLRYVRNVGSNLRQSDQERRNWRYLVHYISMHVTTCTPSASHNRCTYI
jgi:hypothetical protein